MATKKKMLMSAAGSAGGAGLDIDEVFSTYLFTPNTSGNYSISNGVDLDGEGGLVWLKQRDTAAHHLLYDTNRGASGGRLAANLNNGEALANVYFDAFNSDGFTVKDMLNDEMASWTFRKAPKFFTCVQYTGTGPGSAANEQQVSHDLGAKPGIVIVKRTDSTGNWWVFTDVIDGSNDYGYLNQTAAFGNSANNVATDSVFNVGGVLNTSGATYVAYLFANNDGDGEFGPDGDQDIIKCGSYTTDGSNNATVELGWEPQFVLIKRTDSTGSWNLFDSMRGMGLSGVKRLEPENSGAESDLGTSGIQAFSTGFNHVSTYAPNADMIYIAIRRGPLAVPEDATEVFGMDDYTGGGDGPVTGFVTDFALFKNAPESAVESFIAMSRLTGQEYLLPSSTAAGATLSNGAFDRMDGAGDIFLNTYNIWGWKRAPGYFDAVAYTGNGTAGRTVSHNLGVAPEMVWFKKISAAVNWLVYHKDLTGSYPSSRNYLSLNLSSSEYSTYQALTALPTESSMTLSSQGIANGNNDTYIAYLFASCPGVSKVGSYTGNGSSQTIDCGFTAGARFVLIKRTNGADDWHVFDTERGIVASGNDKKLDLNLTRAERSNDWLEPHSTGFSVTSNAEVNDNSGTFIFYAIA